MATQEALDSLLDKGELTPDERDYLHVLGMLVYEYEQTLEPIPDIYGVELLKALIAEFELRQKDLVPIFKTESIVSDILREKRKLTTEHIQKLAEFFRVSPAVFFRCIQLYDVRLSDRYSRRGGFANICKKNEKSRKPAPPNILPTIDRT